MRFDVGFDESLSLSLLEFGALQTARRASPMVARVLSLDQFGFLVDAWNALDHWERSQRHQYCVDHQHRYVSSPYPRYVVCQRCLHSYEVDL